MSALTNRIDLARMAFGRLTQREQMIVVAGGALAAIIILTGVGLMVSNGISKAERRVAVKTEALTQIIQLQGEYKAREQAQSQRLRALKSKSGVRLVKLVEDAARNAGVDIGQLSPDEGEPNDDGIIESRVDLRASDLSIDRLQDFLSRLESSAGMVIVRRLRINKPYRKETLSVDVTVTTFKIKG